MSQIHFIKSRSEYNDFYNIPYRDNRDLTGELFGELKVLSKHPKKAIWFCECTCGEVVPKATFLLVNLKSSMCGKCHRKEKRERREQRCAFQKDHNINPGFHANIIQKPPVNNF